MTRPFACFLSAWIIASLAGGVAAQSVPLPEKVTYNRHIRPILSSTCFQCHGHDANARKAGRRLDTSAGARATNKGIRALVPGRPNESEILRRVRSHDPKHRMPPPKSKKGALTARQIALIERWIAQGGEYERHWSLITPTRPRVPPVLDGWSSGPIDRFVLANLNARRLGVSPPEADRRRLIRRVTFDLIGLPPTPAEVEAFVRDKSANAYEKVVDRLLASPHFGERMAVSWLDAARFADTSAYHADGPRDMWAWRDWVVDAFNDNMPYDQFTIEQLAGDLIPAASNSQKIASAFNRNHCSSDEGGAFPEELRVGYVVDRVKTTSMVWLGLTMECGQCHSHKYDPITHKEYYEFYAFFNRTSDPGMQTRSGNQKPIVGVIREENKPKIPPVRARVAAIEKQMKARDKAMAPAFVRWLDSDPHPDNELPSDMLAHFPLDNSVANSVVDAGGRSEKVAARMQGPPWIEGRTGAALRFDGKNYVDLGELADFGRTDGFSYGAWVYPEAKRQGAAIARMDDKNAHRGYDLLVGANQGVTVHLVHSFPGNAVKVTTKKKLKPGKWQHVFATYDGSSSAGGVTIYVDGEVWPLTTNRNSLTKTTRTKAPLQLGRRKPGAPFNGRLDDVRIFARTLAAAEVALLAGRDPIGPIVCIDPEDRTEKMLAPLRRMYMRRHDPKWLELDRKRALVRGELDKLETPFTSVMVMGEMAKPRKTFILDRGSYDQPTKEEVEPGVPASLPPFGARPKNRLGLAQWLTDPGHPLTARVTVNRFWYQVFGRGLVRTVEDFGAQGTFPSHPGLLDWLALDFIEHGWDVKRLMRQMVTSATYRQSARVSKALRAVDPENEFVARGPRQRLDAEFIRDMALHASGLLVQKLGGPGVKPYQPPGLWNEISLNKNVRFRQDKGDALYRRSLYTYWKRSAPPPSMRIFGAPTRERCIIRRPKTNTPLQALVTLNDPQFLEAARFLAQRMIRLGGKTTQARVDFAYRRVLAREPQPEEVEVFRQTLAPVLVDYRKHPDKAKKLLAVGESGRDAGVDAAEHAAWMVIASMILNLDEALTK